MLLRSIYIINSFHVYNPATKLSRKISFTVTQSENNPYAAAMLALAFDPSKSPHYKVVCVWSVTYDAYYVKVYDSESRAWNLALGQFTSTSPGRIRGTNGGVYWNESIFWEMTDEEICYFDIAQNEFKTLSKPNYSPIQVRIVKYVYSLSLHESNGRLYKSRLVAKDNCQSIEMFELEMEDDSSSSSWLLRYDETISQHECRCNPRFCPSFGSIHQMRFIKGSETCSVVSYECGTISVYSFLDKSYKLLVDTMGHSVNMYEFVECFVVV